MRSIIEIQKKYYIQINRVDLDVLIAHVIKKEREFVLAHPEFNLTPTQIRKIDTLAGRRLKNEPLSYIVGSKEFYGLNFLVNEHTLIPRPETELMVDMAIEEILNTQYSILNIIDIGTGSGNIIISIANQLEITPHQLSVTDYFAIDISKEALRVAQKNAQSNSVLKKINFFHGNLLQPLIEKFKLSSNNMKIEKSKIIILANLPYLSSEIYKNCSKDVKKYEPKTALYSSKKGLAHYTKLFSQIKLLVNDYKLLAIILIEISPEQKTIISPIIKKYFPLAKIKFKKDLAQKWRICEIKL